MQFLIWMPVVTSLDAPIVLNHEHYRGAINNISPMFIEQLNTPKDTASGEKDNKQRNPPSKQDNPSTENKKPPPKFNNTNVFLHGPNYKRTCSSFGY